MSPLASPIPSRALRVFLVTAMPCVAACGDDGASPPGPIARLEVVSGGGQVDTTHAILGEPIVVVGFDADDRPVTGATIRFSAGLQGGTIDPAVATTDGEGRAQAVWTLGATAGQASGSAALQDRPTVAVTFGAVVEWPKIRTSALAVGYNHGCAIVSPQRVFCWGDNQRGQLGDGSTVDRSTAVPIASDLKFVRVAAGGSHSCALTEDGAAYCWGNNFWGSLGDGTTTERHAPAPVDTDVRFSEIVAGAEHTCGLTSVGDVYCWGFLRNASAPPPATPTRVSGDVRFASITTGDYDLCGIDLAGGTHCFERTYAEEGYYGEPGYTWRPSPLPNPPVFTALTGGLDFMCGLTDVGAAYCWGDNTFGSLGTGDTERRATPTPVIGNHAFRSIHAGYDWVCGVTFGGDNVCWGHNSWSTLGIPAVPPYVYPTPQPMPLPDGVSFATMDGGFYHMCGIDDDTTLVYCWAAGFDGQLGDGKNISSHEFHHETSPVVAHRQ